MSRQVTPAWIPIHIHGLQWELEHSMCTDTKIQVRRDQNKEKKRCLCLGGRPMAQGKGDWRETHPIFGKTIQNSQMLEHKKMSDFRNC